MLLFRIFVVCLCLSLTAGLSACGFQSLYAEKTSSPQSRPDIEISNIPDRDGQYLRNLLIDRIYINGRPQDAIYQLKLSPLKNTVVNMGIQKDATATRAQMQITSEMQLIEKSTGKILLQRTLRAAGSYNLLDNQLATLVSQQNVIESVLQEMSGDVMTELDLYFRRTAAQVALP